MLDPENLAPYLEGHRIVSVQWREMKRSVEGTVRPSVKKLGVLTLTLDSGKALRVSVVNYRSIVMDLVVGNQES